MYISSKSYSLGIETNKYAQLLEAHIGGKARGLLFLKKNNFPVPEFFILDFETLSGISTGKENAEDVIKEWQVNNKIEPDSLWAVRSSAEQEDGSTSSYAGIFKTVLPVKLNDLPKEISEVLNSYSEKNNLVENNGYGIVLQRFLKAQYSGVAFSHNPENIRNRSVRISVIPGMGEDLVSGKADGFEIQINNGVKKTGDAKKNYSGRIYRESIEPIEVSGEQVGKDLHPFLVTLEKGLQKLADLKKHPVDCEFAIANGKLFWLQVRPITTGKEEPFVLDKTASEINYPGVTLPLSLSLISHSFYSGYLKLAVFLRVPEKFLHTNDELLKEMTTSVNGVLYYNVSAWQKLIHELPFGKRLSAQLPVIWGMDKSDFYPLVHGIGAFAKLKILAKLLWSLLTLKKISQKFRANYEAFHREFLKIPLRDNSHNELISLFKNYEKKMLDSWEAPVLNNLMAVFGILLSRKMIDGSRLQKNYPNFFNDVLYSSGDVISVKILKKFQHILESIKNDPKLVELFNADTAELISKKIAISFPKVHAEILDYIEQYGERSSEPELKMESVNFKEEPVLFYAYLKNNLDHPLNRDKKQNAFDYKKILKEEYPYSIKCWFYQLVVKYSIDRVSERENFRFMRTKVFAFLRKIFREMDRQLLAENFINLLGDSRYLTLKEITSTPMQHLYKELIAQRKADYEQYGKQVAPTRFIQQGNALTPVEEGSERNTASDLKGTGCCSGIVKGRVKIVDAEISDNENLAGKIVVANYFEPGKLSLFSKAAAIISVRGNLLSHTAILCREMGIPSIVGVKGLLSALEDGDEIQMDGSTGKIKILR